jgi:hypothetical protein
MSTIMVGRSCDIRDTAKTCPPSLSRLHCRRRWLVTQRKTRRGAVADQRVARGLAHHVRAPALVGTRTALTPGIGELNRVVTCRSRFGSTPTDEPVTCEPRTWEGHVMLWVAVLLVTCSVALWATGTTLLMRARQGQRIGRGRLPMSTKFLGSTVSLGRSGGCPSESRSAAYSDAHGSDHPFLASW